MKTLRFFHEIDEGLWFYLRGPRLAPVPGSQPRYSESYAKIEQLLAGERSGGELAELSAGLLDRERRRLVDWLDHRGHDEPFLLIRDALYRRLAPALAAAPRRSARGSPDGTGLVLLRACGEDARIAGPAPGGRTLR